MRQLSADIAGMADLSKSEVIPIDKGLPAAGQRVIVVCRQFRLLGYRDAKGSWREERRPDEVLENVIGWQELGLGEQYACQPDSLSYAASPAFRRLRA